MSENKLQRKNRSISLSEKGMKAVEFLQENSINVSNYIEKLLLRAIENDLKQVNEVKKGEF